LKIGESKMPKYEKLATDEKSIGGATVDVDWRKDDAIAKETKWGGIVTFVDGHVDGYNLGSILRM
jgi:prepilin-type processing-associated H-X9-DG protein